MRKAELVEKIQITIQIQYFHENNVCEAILLWRTNYCLTCKKLLLISQQLLWENDMILGQNTNSLSSRGTKSFFTLVVMCKPYYYLSFDMCLLSWEVTHIHVCIHLDVSNNKSNSIFLEFNILMSPNRRIYVTWVSY